MKSETSDRPQAIIEAVCYLCGENMGMPRSVYDPAVAICFECGQKLKAIETLERTP